MVRRHHRRHVRLAAGAALATGLAALAAAEGLPPVRVIDGGIPEPLTDEPGDPVRGRRIAVDSNLGNCLICHAMPIPGVPGQGDLGPDLAGVADRLTIPELRLRIADPKLIDPDTIMPAYHRTEGLTRVAEAYRGRPILDAQQVEDLIAYLATLRVPMP